ncbi:MAG: M56 family metallopeptidase [Psychroflexus sp.]
METFVINFSLFLFLFWGLYILFFKKETFFHHNRVYLILTPILATVLPFILINQLNINQGNTFNWQEITPLLFTENIEEVNINAANTNSNIVDLSFKNVLIIVYFLGVAFMLFNFFRKLKLYHVLKNKAKSMQTAFGEVYVIQNSKAAFTFLNKIFIGDLLENEAQKEILQHEVVHKKQKHSFDLVYYEILKIIFWFHPSIYSLQNQIKLIHEYIADAKVSSRISKKKYYENLLNGFFDVKQISFTSQFFNHSLIKKRIIMLQKSKSNKTALLKYLMVIPLSLAMLTYVSCSQDESMTQPENNKQETSEVENIIKLEVEDVHNLSEDEQKVFASQLSKILSNNTPTQFVLFDEYEEKSITINEEVRANLSSNESKIITETESASSDEISFAIIDTPPLYIGCDANLSKEEAKKCFSQKISEFVGSNFNIDLAKENGLTGVHRIYVRFKISKEGQITDVQSRSKNSFLGEEAERVIKNLPQMKPGENDGQKVGVLYSLPISFEIK